MRFVHFLVGISAQENDVYKHCASFKHVFTQLLEFSLDCFPVFYYNCSNLYTFVSIFLQLCFYLFPDFLDFVFCLCGFYFLMLFLHMLRIVPRCSQFLQVSNFSTIIYSLHMFTVLLCFTIFWTMFFVYVFF